MPPDQQRPPDSDNLQSEGTPPLAGAAPPVIRDAPPLLPALPVQRSHPLQQLIAIVLSLYLALFLADALISLTDDALILFFDVHLLAGIRGMVFLLTFCVAILTYGLMALTPMIPKRLFLPVTLFNPAAMLAVVPMMIYWYDWILPLACLISLAQTILAVDILRRVQGGLKLRWPLVGENHLGGPGFRWRNLLGFLSVNIFVLLPAAVFYLALCAVVAVDHFSDGFLALRPEGLTVQVRKYVRADGRTVQLFPMAHVGDRAFYRSLSQAFETNAVVLLEGVTDDRNLLTNKVTYERMAATLGLAEQQQEFKPAGAKLIRADLDVEAFAASTIDFMNLVMLLHARGATVENVLKLMTYSAPPGFDEQLFEDLLRKRNRRLLEELHARLADSGNIIVPWGAAHMPELAAEIQKAGFRLDETREYQVVSFRREKRKTPDDDEGTATER